MRDPAQFLEDSLEEQGVTVDAVSHERNIDHQTDQFRVVKRYGGDAHYYGLSIPDQETLGDSREKTLAMHADRMADKIEDEMVEVLIFDGRRIKTCPYEGGWAECANCGTRIELEGRLMPQPQFSRDAELSLPKPRPRNSEKVVEKLSNKARTMLKLYLLGRLREECDPHCPNSRYHIDRKL